MNIDLLKRMYWPCSEESGHYPIGRNLGELYQRTEDTKQASTNMTTLLDRLELDTSEINQLTETFCGIMNAYEQQGFVNGLRMGAQLARALMLPDDRAQVTPCNSCQIDVARIDSVLSNLLETDEWFGICASDPRIQAANKSFDSAMNAVESRITEAEYETISEASSATAAAFQDAALLYGFHVADSLRRLSARPDIYSAHLTARQEV